MNKILLWILLLCSQVLSAQQILDLGIFNNPLNSDKLEVRIKPTETVTGGAYTAGVFTVRFLSSYGVTLTAPSALNNPLYRYVIANQGTDGSYSYYSLSFVSPFTVNWNSGTEYPIAILQINAGCGSGNGVFEIINNAWTVANNGNVYQELNGTEAQNIIYQPTVTAPLGLGMLDIIPPTISCSSNKTAATDFNRCYHTQIDTSWDAIGSDNCPGFIIQYLLSGATVDTLFTLDDAVFNKGITNLNVTVTDGAGLADTCFFTVTVNDSLPPAITAPPTVMVPANAVPCTAAGVALGTPVFSDNCPGVQVANNAPGTFPLGNTVVVWTATDAAGLTATATQTVTVQSNLAATALNLSSHLICNAETANLSFTISGGVGAYTVVFSANGTQSTATGYVSNKLIPVTPPLTTGYKLVSVMDSIGCVILPAGLVDTLTVLPKPSLSSLLPSSAAVCMGESVTFTANGLLPNVSTTFNYTLTPGGPATQTGLSTAAGTFAFDPASNPAGVYTMSIQSITVNGCTTNFSSGNSGSYTVIAFPTISSVSASADAVCLGTLVHITANGLIPNVSTTLYYTLNGVPGSETVLVASTGTAVLLSGVYPEGNYTVVITSVEVAGCSIVTNLSTMFIVDPFQAACGFTVAGKLATETGKGVEESLVTIAGMSNAIPFSFTDFTDTTGIFSFVNTIPLASNYTLSPAKNDNPLNGVTTYDLVLISKHILYTEPLNSPYKMIAADANKSNSISSFDIVELRKLILGIYNELPNNTSWRFIDKYYAFPDTNNPFVPLFPVTITRNNLQMNALNEDFVAVKIGDVNGTVSLGLGMNVENRTPPETLWFDITPSGQQHIRTVKAGESFSLTFLPAGPITGYQFTLNLVNLEVLDIVPSEGMGVENFGVFQDAITCSYVFGSPLEKGAFSITFRARASGTLSQMLAISSRITPAEAYSADKEMARMDVKGRFIGIAAEQKGFELYQNHPNPFSRTTFIPFYLPATDEVRITIFDAFGSLLYSVENRFESGQNTFELDGNLLSGTGMFYYKVESSTAAAAKKLMRN